MGNSEKQNPEKVENEDKNKIKNKPIRLKKGGKLIVRTLRSKKNDKCVLSGGPYTGDKFNEKKKCWTKGGLSRDIVLWT